MTDERLPSPDELLAFLRSPSSYPHEPQEVKIFQTHISYVALAEEWVYKVKKAVDFQFLDFSTLDLREKFCHEEVRLNRRLCSDVYEGVIPIGWKDEQLSFEQTPAVEYAVKMHRLGDNGFLHNRLMAGEDLRDDLSRLADKLAAFYHAQESRVDVADWGWLDLLRKNTQENLEETRPHVGDFLPEETFDTLTYFFDRFYDQHAALLARRRATGCFVEGHGDLRLEHVHVSPEAVCVFDCIEFSERLRSIDIANDVAFLAMDLDVNDRPRLSTFFIDAIADRVSLPLPDHLMQFYKCYRAHVRGKVAGIQSMDNELSTEEREQHQRAAQRHYQQSMRYMVAGSAPLVIAVMGLPATGKSTIAEALGRLLGWKVLSSDRIRKQTADVPLYERTAESKRDQIYTTAATEATYDSLRDAALEECAADRGAVLDATFSSREHRDALREAVDEAGLQHLFIELVAPDDELRDRLRARDGQSTTSDARLEDFEMLRDRYEQPDALEDDRHIRVETGHDEEQTVRSVLRHLVRMQG